MPTYRFSREIEDTDCIEIQAEIQIEAEYSITGSYSPATYCEPAEYPEVELIAAREVETGRAVDLTDDEFDDLQQHALRNRNEVDADYLREIRMEMV